MASDSPTPTNSVPSTPASPSPASATPAGAATPPRVNLEGLHLETYTPPPTAKNANEIQEKRLSKLDRIAIAITDRVGSMGFFIIIFVWTVLWCGYNLLATEIPALHWTAFDPFPAFVAYLLMSNVIQILLMPLIMVGQNLQGRHSEIRAELDFEINQKAEKEIVVLLRHLEHNTDLLIHLMEHLDCRVSREELRAFEAEKDLANQIADIQVAPPAA